ncbi:MAG: glycerol dehydrogenase, partial [Psychromonas sp.]
NLHMMGVKKLNIDKLREVAAASCAEGETIYNMPFEVTTESVLSAILTANELGK